MGTVGERIRLRRTELGLSLRALTERGLSYSYISRIGNEQRTPSMKTLFKLAPELGVSTHWLETGQDDPAQELARLVLEHPALLPERAGQLACAILGDDPRAQRASDECHQTEG